MSVLDRPPDEIVAVLLATADDPSHPERNEILEGVRRHLLKVARGAIGSLRDEIEDVVQRALTVIARRDRLASIDDPKRFWGWARSILYWTGKDAIDAAARRRLRVTSSDEDVQALIDRLLADDLETPEDRMHNRALLALVIAEIGKNDVGKLRLLEDLTEEEVCERLGLTRDQVAQALKRLRARLRRMFVH